MFRSVADVVLKDDLRGYLKLPRIRGGQRQLITAPASEAFRDYQKHLARRIEAIQQRTTRVQPGDDILLAVITDGRHAAIDMRLVWPANDDEPDNKLNRLIANVHRIWQETAEHRYTRPDGTPYPDPGRRPADLLRPRHDQRRGETRLLGLSLDQAGAGPAAACPASEIAYMQDFKKSADKQRLFNDFNAGRVRVLIGSSETMGTGTQRAAAAEGPAPPRRALAAVADRAARGPDRAPGQPARRDRALRLRDARLDGRHHVAEQRAQGALHRRRPVRRPQRPRASRTSAARPTSSPWPRRSPPATAG